MKRSSQSVVHSSTISMIRYARMNGITEQELCQVLDRDLTYLNLSTLSLSQTQLVNLIRMIRERTGDEFVGLHAAETLTISDLGILGYLVMNCRDVGQVMEKIGTYYQLTGNVTRLTVTSDNSGMRCCWVPVQKVPAEVERVVLESLMAGSVIHAEELTGQRPVFKNVQFCWPAPQDVSEYVRLFGSRLSFNQPTTSLHYDKVNLNIPIRSSNSELLPVFEKYAWECFQKLNKVRSLSIRTREILEHQIEDLPKMKEVAAELELSPRNFQLKLKEENTTFLQLRDQVRFHYAKQTLALTSFSAAKVGEILGFSEPSAFYRTFKRWSGLTPYQYRKSIRG